jgi:Apea-like HEPN
VRLLDYEHIGFVPELGRFGFGEQRSVMSFAYKLDGDLSRTLARRWRDSAWVAKLLFASPSPLSSALRIALQRFTSSFERLVLTDRLLDIIIALEALCSKENDAVSYRVALRVATLIGKDGADRDSVFKLVSDAYNEQSSLSQKAVGMIV